jgi:hypothetical protein
MIRHALEHMAICYNIKFLFSFDVTLLKISTQTETKYNSIFL